MTPKSSSETSDFIFGSTLRNQNDRIKNKEQTPVN